MQHLSVMVTPNLGVNGPAVHAYGAAYPAAGCDWLAVNQTTVTRNIPSWAIVMCILTFWICGLGLLFLTVKETRVQGSVAVQVRTPDGRLLTEQVGVTSQAQLAALLGQVNQLQAYTAWLRSQR